MKIRSYMDIKSLTYVGDSEVTLLKEDVTINVLSQEALIKQPITVHLELYLFYRFIHFLLYIGQY